MNNKIIYRITGKDKISEDIDISNVQSWTDDVIWPQSVLQQIDPKQILEDAKSTTEITKLHKMGITGKNINIAIIDQRLYLQHPEYQSQIKHYENVGHWPQSKQSADYHGSLVTGCAVGKTTGAAPDANIYYFAANNWAPVGKFKSGIAKIFGVPTLQDGHRKYQNMAIQRILEINKKLPEKDKIRFISCSWGSNNQQFREESDKLFDECEKNGIMVLGGFYKPERMNFRQSTKQGKTFRMDTEEDITDRCKTRIAIPTDCKTTPFYLGGYIYKKYGGSSSTFPYLAGIFACACQGNDIFFTRPNWQQELLDILQDTAIESEHNGKMINPIGIRKRVTQIAREMEMNLIKQNGQQYE